MEYFARAGYREMGTDGVLKNERGERLVVELTFADSSVLMTNVCSILRQEALKCGVDLRLDSLTYSVCSRKVLKNGIRRLCGRGRCRRRSHGCMKHFLPNWRMMPAEIP